MLNPGMTLGPYEIVSPLGAGGMGEVYRARDTRLDRTVAIKVLPAHLADSPERRLRFEREAKAISALNHPHICALYDIGRQESTDFLVMEFVEGETLAARVEKGPLPLDQILQYGIEISDALSKAHRGGVVHRDLKPANIMLTKSGVKLLDFGLAKLAVAPMSSSATSAAGTPPLQDMATSSKPLTTEGTLVGTLQYMAPEQLEGREADARTDVFAFGAVLYEMTTGKRAFEGKSQASVIAAILQKDPPPITALQPMTPPALDRVIKKCLAKDPDERWQTVQDLRDELKWILEGGSSVGAIHESSLQLAAVGTSPLQPVWRRALPWAAAAGIFLLAAIFVTITYWRVTRAPTIAVVSQILPPAKRTFEFGQAFASVPQLSPDGRRLVFLANGPQEKPTLWVRSLDSTEAKPLQGTEGASAPFWSPDGDYLGFFAGRKLKKIEVSGGPPVDVCDVALGQGGSWAPDGTILFSPSGTSPLYRVNAAGGQPVPVTALDQSRQEASHFWPQFLPDNRHFLFYVVSSSADFSGAYVGSLEGGKPKLLLRGSSNAVFAPPGYLLLVRDGTLMAQRFDLGRLELSGDPVVIAQSVGVTHDIRPAMATASRNGILGYWTGASAAGWQLQWFDRDGKPAGSIGGTQIFYTPRLSPNGKELAVAIGPPGSPTRDIWVFDLARGVETRLTFDPFHNWTPVWSPDGTRLAFSSNPKGQFHIYEKAANGTGTTQPLLEDNATEYVDSWSSDGQYIAYGRQDPQGKPGWDIWILPLFGDKKPFPLLQSQFNKEDPSFSPDGKWLAYDSDESGRWEVYIVPFPQGNGKWQVSTGGAEQPRWRRDGKELFYMSAENELMAAGVQEKNGSLEIGNPQPLFQTNTARSAFRTYDVTADGRKFVVITQPTQSSAEPLTLVINWPALLKKL